MRDAAAELVRTAPELVLVLSPHAPRMARSFGISFGSLLSGDFGRFGFPDLRLSFEGAPKAAHSLAEAARKARIEVHKLACDDGLDHGALVPLYFLHQAGYRGAVLVLSLPYPGRALEVPFGRALGQAAVEARQRWSLVASGDMSHRLSPGAPAGFDPRAKDFDATFCAAMQAGDLRAAASVPLDLANVAAEDVLQSTTVAAAALGFEGRGHHVLSYEAPFGVGYLEAILHTDRAPPVGVDHGASPWTSIARAAIRAALRGTPHTPPVARSSAPRAVFVTLRSPDGTLRGCIGRTEPLSADLVQEIADCAVRAATQDTRMPSVTLDELDQLRIEVSILSPIEPVDSVDDLDPARYGVVVSAGDRRGVLLPGIAGVDSVSEQVRIALAKARIPDGAPYQIQRFTVEKHA